MNENDFKFRHTYKVASISAAVDGKKNVSCVLFQYETIEKLGNDGMLFSKKSVPDSMKPENFAIPDNIPVNKDSKLELYTNADEYGTMIYDSQNYKLNINATNLLIKNGDKGKKIMLTEENGKYRRATHGEEQGFCLKYDDTAFSYPIMAEEYDEYLRHECKNKIEKLRKLTKGIQEGIDKSTPIKQVDANAPFNVVATKTSKTSER